MTSVKSEASSSLCGKLEKFEIVKDKWKVKTLGYSLNFGSNKVVLQVHQKIMESNAGDYPLDGDLHLFLIPYLSTHFMQAGKWTFQNTNGVFDP